MNINVSFTLDEQTNFLHKLGYEVKEKMHKMSYPVYHNSVEYENVRVFAVYKNGEEFGKPHSQSFEENDWLNNVFEIEIGERLKDLLLNNVK